MSNEMILNPLIDMYTILMNQRKQIDSNVNYMRANGLRYLEDVASMYFGLPRQAGNSILVLDFVKKTGTKAAILVPTLSNKYYTRDKITTEFPEIKDSVVIYTFSQAVNPYWMRGVPENSVAFDVVIVDPAFMMAPKDMKTIKEHLVHSYQNRLPSIMYIQPSISHPGG